MRKLTLAILFALSISGLVKAQGAPTSSTSAPSTTGQTGKWQGAIPKTAEKPESWQTLNTELLENKLNYGALAAAERMLSFFADLSSKETAYRTIIQLVDLGYPFSTRPLFVTGDLDTSSDDSFSQGYNFYKALVNVDKKMDKWAYYYFKKVNKETFAKYLLYTAIEQYKAGRLDDSIVQLQKILETTKGLENRSLLKKTARTLARIYYEKEEYEKSLEIYDTFLLKLNPVEPSDWVEAAWNLYRLKKFEDAVGYLYNMESKAAHHLVYLEKYVIRALIYREHCSVEATESLINSFEHDFGGVIDGIKLGEPLNKYPDLRRIEHPQTEEYRHVMKSVDELEKEQKELSKLSGKIRPLAEYLYKTELKMLKRRKGLYEDQAMEVLANYLIIMGESLKFLKFDVAREKFNPDRVFKELVPESKILVDDLDDQNFRVHWEQNGDYWRDENHLYKGMLNNLCDK